MAPKKRQAKLGFHARTGQFRKCIKGRTYCFGSTETTALARYRFFHTAVDRQRSLTVIPVRQGC